MGIAHISVLQLLRIRFRGDIKYESLRLDRVAEQPKISGCQCLQKAHAAGAVTETVVGFQGNPVLVVIDSDQIAHIALERHGHTGIADILHDIRTGSVVRFQIAPE